MTFRELVDSMMTQTGMGITNVLHTIRWRQMNSGVSTQALRRAYEGTRVHPETARDLRVWAATVHKVELDELQMLKAPVATKTRGKRDVVSR